MWQLLRPLQAVRARLVTWAEYRWACRAVGVAPRVGRGAPSRPEAVRLVSSLPPIVPSSIEGLEAMCRRLMAEMVQLKLKALRAD